MKIELLTKYYTVSEISEYMGVSLNTLRSKIAVLEIDADLKISGVMAFSHEKMLKICGFYKFEKDYWEIINSHRLSAFESGEDEQLDIFPSKMNLETQ